MRLIHTADWHLGNYMHDIDRTAEQQAFLKWLKQEVNDRDADTLVVAGDVFDVKNPSNESKRMYYRFLASLLDTGCKNVIVVGGNHDSGDLLDTTRELSDALNIHVVGSISGRAVDEFVFELHDQKGDVSAVCAAIPYIKDTDLREYFDGEFEDGTFSDKAYTALYQQVLAEVEKRRNGRDIPVIVTGHMYAAGLEGRYADDEKENNTEIKTDDGMRKLDFVGNLGKVHSNVFPKEFTYVALGHIHYTTRVAKEERIRYSGSPFVMGFDEADISRVVLQVELESGKTAPKVSRVEVPEYSLYERIPGTVDQIIGRLNEIMAEAADTTEEHKNVYVELCYKQTDRTMLEHRIEGMEFPAWLKIVSWKPVMSGTTQKGMIGSRTMKEMTGITLQEVVRSLVLSNLSVDREGLSEEEIAEEEEALVAKYLPYFEKAEVKAEEERKARANSKLMEEKARAERKAAKAAEKEASKEASKEAAKAAKAAEKAAQAAGRGGADEDTED